MLFARGRDLGHGLGAARAAAHQKLNVALVPLLFQQRREELFRLI